MPFKSKAQQRFMFSQHPEIAKEFADATPDIKKLPEHVKKADGGVIPAGLQNALNQNSDTDAEANEPGAKDATVSDILAPLLGAKGLSSAAEALPEISDALGEAGEVSLGGTEEGASEAPKVEAFIKGVQKSPSGDINIWGVKGDPEEIAKLGYGSDPASVPESVLQSKGILPPESQKPSLEANDLRKMWGEVAQEQSGTPTAAVGHYMRPDLVIRSKHMSKGGKVMKKYDDGGPVTSDDSADSGDWKDKLATVMKTLFSSPAGQIGNALVSPVSALSENLTTPDSATQNLGTVAAPVAQNIASALTSGAVPQANQPAPAPAQPPLTPQSQTAQTAQMPPDLEAQMTPPSQPQTAQPSGASAPAQKPSATDILSKLTDGDGNKMAALLDQLKDQDKRSAFAQALGVIGDTFGNMGMAKAGQRPEGFQTPQMLAQMNQQSKEAQIQNLTQQLAADPNSQTSKMAQMTLMQSMGISPNDPRAKQIQAMPAQAVTQMMPQMTDAVKNNIEKEKNLIQAKEADYTHQLAQMSQQIAAGNLTRENTVAMIGNLNDIAKNSPLYRPDMKNQALQMAMQLNGSLSGGMGQTQPPIIAKNSMGHRIRSTDGGHTWTPIQ